MSGHLRDLNMTIAFSIDKLSLGSELAVQVFVCTGSSKISFMVMWSAILIPSEVILLNHSNSSSVLYLAVNGPE